MNSILLLLANTELLEQMITMKIHLTYRIPLLSLSTNSYLPPPPSDPVSQITHLYNTILGREPDEEGLNFWVEQYNNGVSISDITKEFFLSTEFMNKRADEHINAAFNLILGRNPTEEEFEAALANYTKGMSLHELTKVLIDSETFQSSSSEFQDYINNQLQMQDILNWDNWNNNQKMRWIRSGLENDDKIRNENIQFFFSELNPEQQKELFGELINLEEKIAQEELTEEEAIMIKREVIKYFKEWTTDINGDIEIITDRALQDAKNSLIDDELFVRSLYYQLDTEWGKNPSDDAVKFLTDKLLNEEVSRRELERIFQLVQEKGVGYYWERALEALGGNYEDINEVRELTFQLQMEELETILPLEDEQFIRSLYESVGYNPTNEEVSFWVEKLQENILLPEDVEKIFAQIQQEGIDSYIEQATHELGETHAISELYNKMYELINTDISIAEEAFINELFEEYGLEATGEEKSLWLYRLQQGFTREEIRKAFELSFSYGEFPTYLTIAREQLESAYGRVPTRYEIERRATDMLLADAKTLLKTDEAIDALLEGYMDKTGKEIYLERKTSLIWAFLSRYNTLKEEGDPQAQVYLDKAIEILRAFDDAYDNDPYPDDDEYYFWGLTGLNWYDLHATPVHARTLMMVSWQIWDELPQDLKNSIKNHLFEVAEFYAGGEAFDGDYINARREMFSLGEYLGNTRSEELAFIAGYLQMMSVMFHGNERAQDWSTWANFYAFHAFSKGEAFPEADEPQYNIIPEEIRNIVTRNIYDDNTLDNHQIHPNPGYATSSIHFIATAAYMTKKILGEDAVPKYFTEENTNMVAVWNKANEYKDYESMRYVGEFIPRPRDYDFDNIVDVEDLQTDWGIIQWRARVAGLTRDVNNDGVINDTDWQILLDENGGDNDFVRALYRTGWGINSEISTPQDYNNNGIIDPSDWRTHLGRIWWNDIVGEYADTADVNGDGIVTNEEWQVLLDNGTLDEALRQIPDPISNYWRKGIDDWGNDVYSSVVTYPMVRELYGNSLNSWREFNDLAYYFAKYRENFFGVRNDFTFLNSFVGMDIITTIFPNLQPVE